MIQLKHHRNLQTTLSQVVELLDKPDLVSGLAVKRPMPRQDLGQALLAKQHLAELERTLACSTPSCWPHRVGQSSLRWQCYDTQGGVDGNKIVGHIYLPKGYALAIGKGLSQGRLTGVTKLTYWLHRTVISSAYHIFFTSTFSRRVH